MDTRDLVAHHIRHHDLCPGASTLEEWQGQDSLSFPLGRERRVDIPLGPFKRGLTAHDVHHVLAGYPTSFLGEVEVAAFELGSGGCHRHLAFWLDRLTLFAIGLVLHPRASWRALRRGRGCHNLYAMTPEAILASDVATLCHRMGLPERTAEDASPEAG